MNVRQIVLVRSTFALVQPIASDAAALFYDHLFQVDPTLRPLFEGDMTHQGQRLMGMIGSALQLLDRPAALLHVLRSLGARHAGYRVRPEHYDAVGTALILTLEQSLGAAFTPEARAAWVDLYGVIARTMLEGAREQALAAGAGRRRLTRAAPPRGRADRPSRRACRAKSPSRPSGTGARRATGCRR